MQDENAACKRLDTHNINALSHPSVYIGLVSGLFALGYKTRYIGG
jgi:hypothetical protein